MISHIDLHINQLSKDEGPLKLLLSFISFRFSRLCFQSWKKTKAKNKNTFVSGDPGDEKNFHRGGLKIIFLANLI